MAPLEVSHVGRPGRVSWLSRALTAPVACRDTVVLRKKAPTAGQAKSASAVNQALRSGGWVGGWGRRQLGLMVHRSQLC